tara:strand:+ start:8009 stop:8404 length:396 start_codon:yes stop_codon:yes gene_type:complete
MNFLGNLISSVKNYTYEYINSELEDLKLKTSTIEEKYIEIKKLKIKKSKSCNSFFNKNISNKINKIELNNKIEKIDLKINNLNLKLNESIKNHDILLENKRLFEKKIIFLLKHIGAGLLVSSILYKFSIKY